jgi:hypothetical protein
MRIDTEMPVDADDAVGTLGRRTSIIPTLPGSSSSTLQDPNGMAPSRAFVVPQKKSMAIRRTLLKP